MTSLLGAHADGRRGVAPDGAERAGHPRVVGEAVVLPGVGGVHARAGAHRDGAHGVDGGAARPGEADRRDLALRPLVEDVDRRLRRARHVRGEPHDGFDLGVHLEGCLD
ncbi:hypothetical protein GCM10025868_19250 [Angustibacter aerolatus]|uniref:Uncharacterized protein n=1 Tax=Angustibacter aerolatus TaxID=1162965 RepID=A0ABQ6JHH6_9ACTN|nr:hypothetical protein GCM10025868_19250 [Angustibacter aerolatus]